MIDNTGGSTQDLDYKAALKWVLSHWCKAGGDIEFTDILADARRYAAAMPPEGIGRAIHQAGLEIAADLADPSQMRHS